MDKETFYRTLRLIGMVCATILAVIGALGIDVPTLQDYIPASAGAAAVGVLANFANHWFNNNYTAGAKMVQPSIKKYNSMIKNEVCEMGEGEKDE